MNLKESIIKEGVGYKGNDFSTNYFFSSLAQGFLKDRKVLGEETVELYTDIFGEEYGPIFESFDLDAEVLTEAINGSANGLLFEQRIGKGDFMPDYTSGAKGGTEHALRGRGDFKLEKIYGPEMGGYTKNPPEGSHFNIMTGQVEADKKGLLASLWDGLKKFGSSLATKFPGIASFLKNGIGWITNHPAAVLGTAGGAVLIGGIIRALNKRGEKKKAMELQAKLDAAKGKTVEK
jgi:hypothetical protein